MPSGRAVSDEALYLTRAPVGARSIGNTSFVLKVKFEGGLEAAFKPRSQRPRGTERYKAEVAAYRLGLALGLTQIPRAFPRTFAASTLRSVFGGGAAVFEREAFPGPDGSLPGALIPWIPKLEFPALDRDPLRARWEKWLTSDEPIAQADRSMAAQISTMLVFDYVTANWDRWSGGNIGWIAATGTVVFIDNDGAFYDTPPSDWLARQHALLRRVRVFSRRLVTSLRALSRERLGEAMGEERPGVPLLAAGLLDAADARRRRVLEVIGARVLLAGEDRAFGFE